VPVSSLLISSVKFRSEKDFFYQIVTHSQVSRHSEAFISYGAHSNTKLYTEYGFFIHDNPHDYLPVNLRDLQSFFNDRHQICSSWKEKVQILQESRLAENLGISMGEGLGWNLKAALKIASFDRAKLGEWHHVYQDETFANSHNLIAEFTRFLLEQLVKSLSKMQAVMNTRENFTIAIELVASQVDILAKTLADLENVKLVF
jgi:hypothetical protein